MSRSYPNSKPSDKAISTAPCKQSNEYEHSLQLQGWLQAHIEFNGLHCLHLQKATPVACVFSKGFPCLSITVVSPENRTEAKYFFLCRSSLTEVRAMTALKKLLLPQNRTASYCCLKYRTTAQQSSKQPFSNLRCWIFGFNRSIVSWATSNAIQDIIKSKSLI